jgi:cytochrome oxidase assembly protein ShyY1
MRRLAFLFRPQWLALYVVVIGFAYLCFTVLAPWQLGKNTKTSRENAQISASLKADPVPVTSLLPHQDSAARDDTWKQVTATGHYLPRGQVLARLRSVNGDPAFEVLVPFAVDGGPTVLVDRGYVKPAEGSKAPPIDAAPTGTVTITARLRDSEGVVPGKAPFRQDDAMQVYSISTAQIAQVTGTPLAGSYLQLVDDQPGGLGVIPLPHLDSGPFLSYGIQWIAFGIVAPLGVGYFVLAEFKQRKRERAPNPARPAANTATSSGSPGADGTSATPAPQTTEEKLADRYGRRR